MKAKLISRQSVIFDHDTWNEDKTAFGQASEFDNSYLDYVPSNPPDDAPAGLWYVPYYEVQNGKICQLWELPELTLEELKAIKIQQIKDYDKSPAVNQFYVTMGGNKMPMWIKRETRVSLMNTLNIEEMMGRENSILWTETTPPFPIELPITEFRQLLAGLEIYAKDAYGVTQQHELNVSQISDKNQVLPYDNTALYPTKLNVTI